MALRLIQRIQVLLDARHTRTASFMWVGDMRCSTSSIQHFIESRGYGPHHDPNTRVLAVLEVRGSERNSIPTTALAAKSARPAPVSEKLIQAVIPSPKACSHN